MKLPPLPPTAERLAAYFHAALAEELAVLAQAVPGVRNLIAFGCARRLAQLFEACRPPESEVTEQLVATAVTTGLERAEAGRTIASGLRAGRQRPRQPRERPPDPSQARGATAGLHDRIMAAADADPSMPAGARAALRGELAGAHGKLVWNRAVRESAKSARVAEGTVVYWRKRLVARGWLAPVPDRPGVVDWRHGQTWMPGPAALSEAARPEHTYPHCRGGPRSREAFRSSSGGRRDLGHATEGYFDRLLGGPQTVAELADAVDRDPDTVRYHLAKLAGVGLAERRADGRWAATGRDPAEVARKLGLAGATAHQQQRHHRQRLAATRRQRHLRRKRTKRWDHLRRIHHSGPRRRPPWRAGPTQPLAARRDQPVTEILVSPEIVVMVAGRTSGWSHGRRWRLPKMRGPPPIWRLHCRPCPASCSDCRT